MVRVRRGVRCEAVAAMSDLLTNLRAETGLAMGPGYAPTSFTDPETREDRTARLHVGYTTDQAKAETARDMGATVTTCRSKDPRFTGYEVTVRVIDP